MKRKVSKIPESKRTRVEWAEVSLVIQYGCQEYSLACKNCYAASIAYRFNSHEVYQGLTKKVDGKIRWTGKLKQKFETVDRIKKLQNLPQGTRVFLCSMTDWLYGNFERLTRYIFKLCEAYPHLIFQILTKRSDMLVCKFFPPNLYVGVTVEHNKYLYRIDDLRDSNASIKFVSFEPLLSPMSDLDLTGIDWVIVGGQTGAGAGYGDCKDRAGFIDAARKIKAEAERVGAEFFFKKMPLDTKKDIGVDGFTVNTPKDLRIRQLP